ncbi:hypothetical protein BC834DRAFT_975159 [Gloeopeniophorella convolvens]|nr:hypothetical protein BC834DRAFT_975159 [Gloeopeniophorella convolvens]
MPAHAPSGALTVQRARLSSLAPRTVPVQLRRNRLGSKLRGYPLRAICAQPRFPGAAVRRATVVVGCDGVSSCAAHARPRYLRLVDSDSVTISPLDRHAAATREGTVTLKVACAALQHAIDNVGPRPSDSRTAYAAASPSSP